MGATHPQTGPIAGFLLTRLLLPMLESRTSSRIVNVASAGQQPIDFADVMLTGGYSGARTAPAALNLMKSRRPIHSPPRATSKTKLGPGTHCQNCQNTRPARRVR
jgi:NAD(P)-dependent dehydrogenase (short-subunit alcohol dehydrogenase family)